MDKLSRDSVYKNKITNWRKPFEEREHESSERHRSCNISATQGFVERIDYLLEQGIVEYNSRSEFLRNIILEKVAEIEAENNVSEEVREFEED